MNITLDARKLWDGGIGSYIRGLLGALARDPGGHAFSALLGPADLGMARWPGPVREVAVTAGKYGLMEHLAVPRAARAIGTALLHEPHYTLPFGWSGPAVVTIHDLIHVRFAHLFPPGTGLYARAMAGAAVRRARRVIVNSAHTRGEVVALLGAPESKVRAIHLGISERFQPPERARVERFMAARRLPRDPLLYVGARKAHKNLPLLLDAVALIPAERRPPLVISGPPPGPRDPLARALAARGLGSAVRFAGPVADEDELSCLYAGAALYVQPSLTEGFGLPPLEAMACGTPVLSSDAGGLPEALGDAAVLLAPREPEAWAAAIERLLGDRARLGDLVRRGRERARAFTWERNARETLEVYERAVEG